MNYIIGMLIASLFPIIFIDLFSKIDKEIGDKIKLTRKDIITILIVSICYVIAINILHNYQLEKYINIFILTGYLIFMSYTDQKTELLYTSISVSMIILEVIWLLVNKNNIYVSVYDYILILIVILLLLISITGHFGFGDVLIYIVLIIFNIIYSPVAFYNILINLVIANEMFILVNVIRKDTKGKKPFTLYISISTFICNLFLI